MDCRKLRERILSRFGDLTEVRLLNSHECLVRLPFWDGTGDPIELSVYMDGERATIDDAGAISGLLFSLGQHNEGTPAFKLLENLVRTHGLEIDFDEGLVKLSVADRDLYEGIAELAKVILAIHTTVPHIRVSPRRTGSLGPRLRSKIAHRYQELNILDLVQRSYHLSGAAEQSWPVDFHWLVRSNGHSHAVNVVAADLSVAEPFEKAHKIAALSVDTARDREGPGGDKLRVVMERPVGNARSVDAADFIRFHSNGLAYEVFDLGNQDEQSEFYRMSVGNSQIRLGPIGKSLYLVGKISGTYVSMHKYHIYSDLLTNECQNGLMTKPLTFDSSSRLLVQGHF